MNETRHKVKSAHWALPMRSRLTEQKEDFKTGCVTINVFFREIQEHLKILHHVYFNLRLDPGCIQRASTVISGEIRMFL